MDSVFADLRIVDTGPTWTLYRDGDALFVVRYHGDIDDDASDAWRAAALANVEAEGWPRHVMVAPTEGAAVNFLASRIRTAAFLRRCCQQLTSVVILDDHKGFVARTIMRAAGINNVELHPVVAAAVLAELRAAPAALSTTAP